jgi:hypothetical protein
MNRFIKQEQFTRYDEELHPECDNKEYLEYEKVSSDLSKNVICSYGYKEIFYDGNYKWLKIKEAKMLLGE